MNEVEVWLDRGPPDGPAQVGVLIRDPSKTGDAIRFEYLPDWLRSGFALEPGLMLTAGPHYARAGADQLAGCFVDASPDRWGKLLMERREAIEARQQGRRVRTLRSWDFLLGVNDEARMGALRLRDPAGGRYLDDRALGAPPVSALRELESVAATVERGDADDINSWVLQLVAPGASLGGARPKAGFRDVDGSLWLAKFPSAEDRRNVGLWEYLAYQLSIDAGIDMPEARPLPLSGRGHTFAVRRFDRAVSSRRGYVSAMTLLDVDDSESSSYLDIVAAIEQHGAPGCIAPNLEQLFRRVLFNVLVGNRDDHLRNHGFLRGGGGWRLSPAFDVNPNPDRAGHVLAIDEVNRVADSQQVVGTADYYRLGRVQADRIASEVRAAVRPWRERARDAGLPRSEIEAMGDTIDPDR